MAKTKNPVEDAIERLGGIHQAVLKTEIPYPTLLSYRRRGRVPRYEQCVKLANAAGVDPAELAGLVPRKSA